MKSCRLRLPSGGGIGIEGIDQSRNFYWVDDNTDEASVAALEEIGLSSRLIVTSTDERPNDLIRVRRLLEKVTVNDQTTKQRCHTMENTELLETKLGAMNYFFYYATIMMTFISHNGFYVFL